MKKNEWAIIKYKFENQEVLYKIHKPSFVEGAKVKLGGPDLVADNLTREEAEALYKLMESENERAK
jgi:hypothetical protein